MAAKYDVLTFIGAAQLFYKAEAGTPYQDRQSVVSTDRFFEVLYSLHNSDNGHTKGKKLKYKAST